MKFLQAKISTSDGRELSLYLASQEDAEFIVRSFQTYAKVVDFDYDIKVEEKETLSSPEIVRIVVESFREQRDERNFIDKVEELLSLSE